MQRIGWPRRWFATHEIAQVEAPKTTHQFWRRLGGCAKKGRVGNQRSDLLTGKPRVIEVPRNLPPVVNAGIHLAGQVSGDGPQDQSTVRVAVRSEPVVLARRFRRGVHREVVPPLERRLEHLKEWTGITGVQCAKGRAPRCADVQALPGRRGEGASAIVSLFGDEAEELTLGIGLRLQRRAVLCHR